MTYDTISFFPDDIDQLTFFQDIQTSQKTILNQASQYADNSQLSVLSTYLNSSDVDSYSAELFKMLENRIKPIQEYLLSEKKDKIKFYEHNCDPYVDDNPYDSYGTFKIWDLTDGKVDKTQFKESGYTWGKTFDMSNELDVLKLSIYFENTKTITNSFMISLVGYDDNQTEYLIQSWEFKSGIYTSLLKEIIMNPNYSTDIIKMAFKCSKSIDTSNMTVLVVGAKEDY